MNKFKLTCLAAGLSVASISANAFLITDWTYSNEAGFKEWSSDPNADDPSGINPSGATADEFDPLFGGELPKTLSWGEPYGAVNPDLKQSALEIGPAVSGSVETTVVDGVGTLEFETGTGLTHENWGVTGDTLATAKLFDGLFLTPTAPVLGPTLAAPTLQFEVIFEETYNTPSNDVCKYGDTLVGEAGVNVKGCADLFTLVLAPEVTYQDVGGDIYLSNSFTIDDYIYTLTTRLQGLQVLTDIDCGDGSTCIGFLTEEDQSNVLQAGFAISAARVPEPGTLAIFGLGLLGLASIRRRA
jgi:hypothetical protein